MGDFTRKFVGFVTRETMVIFDGKIIYDNENGDLPYVFLDISCLCGNFDGYSFYWLVINHKWGYEWLLTGISGHNLTVAKQNIQEAVTHLNWGGCDH